MKPSEIPTFDGDGDHLYDSDDVPFNPEDTDSLQDREFPPSPRRISSPHSSQIPCLESLQERYPWLTQNTVFVGCVVVCLVLLVTVLSLLALSSSPPSPPTTSQDALALYHALSAAWTNETLSDPLLATYVGVEGPVNGALPDLSWGAIVAGAGRRRALYEQAQALSVAELTADDDEDETQTNARILQEELRFAFLRDQFLELDNLLPVSPMVGPQIELPGIVGETPFASRQDFLYYLQRLAAIPTYIDQTITLLRKGVDLGITQPCDFIQTTAAQIEAQIHEHPEDSDFYVPFVVSNDFKKKSTMTTTTSLVSFSRRFKKASSSSSSSSSFSLSSSNLNSKTTLNNKKAITSSRYTATPDLQAAGLEAVRDQVIPSFSRLHSYFVDTYLHSCHTGTTPLGLGALPNGAAYYDVLVKEFTTDPTVDAPTLHQLGLEQVQLVRGQMEAALARSGLNCSFSDCMDAMRDDPSYQFGSKQAALMYARDLGKQVDAMLPARFAVLPRCPYAIVAVPDGIAESSPAGYYDPPDVECTRPGVFHLNAYGSKVTKFLLPSLFLHEAVPGHHLQIALANEQTQPFFRVNGDWTAFIEGWAHFAEYFGEELGFYEDPIIDLGRLSDAMLRACRLVIDTGFHNGTMTRQQAIDLLAQNSALALADIEAEVDRYGSWPGQAVAYRYGMLTFQKIQSEGKQSLGDLYDERHFNSAMLAHGALPLNILIELMNQYVQDQLD